MTAQPPVPTLSFEFFPPKTPQAAAGLWAAVERLAPLAPRFVSVTYGAGGTTRERTLAAILAICDRARLPVAGHLTCVGASRDEVMGVARAYAKLGCRRIVALRGDQPGGGPFVPHPEGFSGSVELIAALAEMRQFEIWVGAYPEIHPEATDARADIDHLKRKIDAGATGAITQFFFQNGAFYRFRDACAAAGIDAPILPGILPIENFDKMVRFAAQCGAEVPDTLRRAFSNAETKAEEDLLALAVAAEQCDDLRRQGCDHIHLYTLNKPDLTAQVAQALGVVPSGVRTAAGCA